VVQPSLLRNQVDLDSRGTHLHVHSGVGEVAEEDATAAFAAAELDREFMHVGDVAVDVLAVAEVAEFIDEILRECEQT